MTAAVVLNICTVILYTDFAAGFSLYRININIKVQIIYLTLLPKSEPVTSVGHTATTVFVSIYANEGHPFLCSGVHNTNLSKWAGREKETVM